MIRLNRETSIGSRGGKANELKKPTDFEDADSMLKAARGDRAAFARVFERHKDPVMGYLKTILSDERVAEELTQETFLRAYRARESYEKKAKVSTWLFTIAKNAAFDHLDKKKELSLQVFEDEEGSLLDPLAQLESEIPDSEAQLIEEADRRAVEKCLGELPPQQREIVALRIFSELSYEEIATQMKAPLGSVKTLLFRAKEKLTDCFKRGCAQDE